MPSTRPELVSNRRSSATPISSPLRSFSGVQPEAMRADDSRGVAGLGPLPAFELAAADGRRVRSWDFRNRSHLVVWLVGSSPDRDAVAQAGARQHDLQSEGAELLLIVAGVPGSGPTASRRIGAQQADPGGCGRSGPCAPGR
jgi:hypothetical protein